MMRRVRALIALTWEERWVFAVSLLLLPLFAVGLHRLGMARMRALLEGRSSPPAAEPLTPERYARARRIAVMVNAAARLSPYKANCLKRSLVYWWLLRRRAIASDLRIGVRKGAGETLEAHAWVEAEGRVLNDSPALVMTFTPFAGDMIAAFRFSG